MAIHSPSGAAADRPDPPRSASSLEKLLRSFSVITMAMTVPQVWTIWTASDVGGVSVVSWASYLASACLWFVYGLQKKDKTIYLACVGWVLLDAAIVVGIIVRG